MADDKTIKLGVDASGVAGGVNQAKTEIQKMYEEMARIASQRNPNSKDAVRDIEDQIKAQQRLNQVRELGERNKIVGQMNRGEISSALGGAKLSDISDQAKEDRLSILLLQQIVDNLKELRRSSEKIGEEEKRTILGKNPEDLTLEEKIKRERLERENPEERRRNRGAEGIARWGGAVVGGGLREGGIGIAMGVSETASHSMMHFEPGEEAGGWAKSIPIIGAIVAVATMATKAVIDKSNIHQANTANIWRSTGEDFSNFGFGLDQYGVSSNNYLERMHNLSKTRLSSKGLDTSTINQILLEKGIGLDINQYNSFDKLSLLGGGTAMGDITSTMALMGRKRVGMLGEDNKSAEMVPSMLNIIAELGKEQVSKLGRIDIGMNSKMVVALASMDETLKKSPEALSTMVNSVKGGLSGANSPQSEALQYSILKRINPNADMFELQKMREKPFSEGNRKYLPMYLDQLKRMSGGNQHRFYQNIMGQFGLSAEMSEMLGSGYDDKRGDFQSILNSNFDINGNELIKNRLPNRARKSTTYKEQTEAFTENQESQLMLNNFSNGLKEASGSLFEFTKAITTIITAAQWVTKQQNEINIKSGGNVSPFHGHINGGVKAIVPKGLNASDIYN